MGAATAEIPWLFAEPQFTLADWRSRLQFLLAELEREARLNRADLGRASLSPLTCRRLELMASANEDHAARLRQLLAPIGVADVQAGYETHLALRTQLPVDQGLTNYYVNIHRDWCWGAEENEASVALIRSTVPAGHDWGRTLVLGAGAGRLAYDLHMQFAPSLTVAADFNPLLLFVAAEVTQGRQVELYEFPIAPRRLEDHAILRSLRAPAPVRTGFHLVAADALRAPFEPGSFDTVITPWLIDVIAEPLPRFAARINGLLRPGGAWINFGSLSFAQGDRTQRLSLEEAMLVVGSAGFTAPQSCEATMPYMASPASRHARRETVLAWFARKEREATQPGEHSTLPEWLIATHQPVPKLEDFQIQQVSTRIHAFLMALIDGRRSVQDMARMLVEQRLIAPADAESSVRAFLTRMYEDSQRRAGY
jgi:SAM-dependent methyltransferase